jgi:membrane protease YdiL (CAAX protease family)
MTDWLRPVPPGRPFHQLDRTDVHRWWRPALGLVLMLVLAVGVTVVFVVWLVVMVWTLTGDWLEFAGTGDALFVNGMANLFALLGSLAVLLPVVWFVTLVINRRWIGTLASVEGHIRWRWLLLCLVPAAAYMGLAIAASYGLDAVWPASDDGGTWPGWHAFWPPLLMIVLLVPFQAAAEEFIFRGWLLQAIGSWTFETRGGVLANVFGTAWPAIMLSALPFVAGHTYTDWGILDIGVFAVVTGWVTVKTGGLEAAIALHVVNNITGMTFSAAEGDLSLAEGSVPFPDVASDVVSFVLWALAVVWIFGHTGSRRPMKRLS